VLGPQSAAGVRMSETASYFEFISAEMAGLVARWEARAAGAHAADGISPSAGSDQ
jgi:hypothetical protein